MAVSRMTKEAWMNLGPNLANIFQGIGAKRQRRAEFEATMAMAELQRRDAQEATDKAAAATRARLEFDKDRTAWEMKVYEEGQEKLEEADVIRKQTAEAYQGLHLPEQMPPGPPSRFPGAGAPERGMGTPYMENINDVIARLKNKGASPEAIQSIVTGGQGPLPITQPPAPIDPMEILNMQKTMAETEKINAQIYRIFNPLTRAGGDKAKDAELDITKLLKLRGDLELGGFDTSTLDTVIEEMGFARAETDGGGDEDDEEGPTLEERIEAEKKSWDEFRSQVDSDNFVGRVEKAAEFAPNTIDNVLSKADTQLLEYETFAIENGAPESVLNYIYDIRDKLEKYRTGKWGSMERMLKGM